MCASIERGFCLSNLSQVANDFQKELNVVAEYRAHVDEATWRDAYQTCMDVVRVFH